MIKKRKILFVINDLNFGGAQKSLINLLKHLDYEFFEVDLQLMEKGGELELEIPKQIELLKIPINYKYFDTSFKKVFFENFFNFKWKVILNRILYRLNFDSKNSLARNEQIRWRFLKNILPINPKKYDFAIGYLEKTPTYYVVDKTMAEKKISWIHTDYENLKVDTFFENEYFDKIDKIVAVSNSVSDILVKLFPFCNSKITVLNNIFSVEEIKSSACQQILEVIKEKNVIVSVGRLVKEKAFDMAIEVAKILKNKNLDFYWYFIGDGDSRKTLEKLIKKYRLEKNVFLLGYKKNPYPYIDKATIYVQTSIFEGFALTIQEAKILKKPVICTNFTAAKNHIIDKQNGFIVDYNSNEIAEIIEELLVNKSLREKIITNIEDIKTNEKNIIEKFDYLLND